MVDIEAGGFLIDPPSAYPIPGTRDDTFNLVLTSDVLTDTICYRTDATKPAMCMDGVCGTGSTAYASNSPIPITTDNTRVNSPWPAATAGKPPT